MKPAALRSRALLLTLATLAPAVFAGCMGNDPAPEPAPVTIQETGLEVGKNATGGLGALETNETVEGIGGKAHIHDYWEGREKVVIYEGLVASSIWPVIPNRDPSRGVFMARLRLPFGALVYEGTGKMEILATQPSVGMSSLRMAAWAPNMEEPGDLVPLAFDTPLEMEITPQMTDMPHGSQSLWQWLFYSDGTAKPLYGNFHVTITIYKARNVEAWPGHPDFYKGKTHRVLLENKEWTSRYAGFEDTLFGQYPRDMIAPDLLVSMGTARLEVFVNVTKINAHTEPTNYYLDYVNATRVSVKSSSAADANFTLPSRHYTVRVDNGSHDSPYGEKSRWGFRLRAIAPGAPYYPYEVTYTLTIIAYPWPANATADAKSGAERAPRPERAPGDVANEPAPEARALAEPDRFRVARARPPA